MRQLGQFDPIVCDVEYIRVDIDVVNAIWVDGEDPLELFFGLPEICTLFEFQIGLL